MYRKKEKMRNPVQWRHDWLPLEKYWELGKGMIQGAYYFPKFMAEYEKSMKSCIDRGVKFNLL